MPIDDARGGSHKRDMARRIAVEIFLMIAAGLLLALLGPFGTYAMPMAQRLVLWPLMILSGYPIFRGLGAISDWLAETTHIPPLVATALALAIGSLPMTAIVAMLWMGASPDRLLASDGVGLLYLQVLVIGVVVNSAMHLLFRPVQAGEKTAAPAASPPLRPPPVDAMSPAAANAAPDVPAALPLPPGFGAVIALSGEDHYVRAHSVEREALLLLRLRDAIALMPADAGLRVHRSWWVAKDGVARVERDGRTARLHLVNGTTVPVARDAMPLLRQMGWVGG